MRDHHAHEIHDDDDAEHRERPPLRADVRGLVGQESPDRGVSDDEAGECQDHALGEGREVLRLAMSPGVGAVRGAHRHPESEEGQEGGDEVRPGVQRLGDESQAVGRETDGELERDEERRGEDRDERGAAGGRHIGMFSRREGDGLDALRLRANGTQVPGTQIP